MKKTIIVGISVHSCYPTYKQMIAIANEFMTDRIENNGNLQVRCFIEMNLTTARVKIRDILDCKFSQIRVKYHEE